MTPTALPTRVLLLWLAWLVSAANAIAHEPLPLKITEISARIVETPGQAELYLPWRGARWIWTWDSPAGPFES